MTIGKRLGLSFYELNDMRVTDLLDMARSFSGVKDDRPREATQEDINSFYG